MSSDLVGILGLVVLGAVLTGISLISRERGRRP